MKRDGEMLSDEAQLLNRYLNQYKICISKKRSLEYRRRDILQEFESPLSGVKMDGMPKGNSTSVGCAALSFKLDDIESRINEQIVKSSKVLTEIMDVIEFLPENSMERAVIEHKYIDRFNWDKVCRAEHISRTPAIRYWRKGLYELLEFKKIGQVLHDYEQELAKEA